MELSLLVQKIHNYIISAMRLCFLFADIQVTQ